MLLIAQIALSIVGDLDTILSCQLGKEVTGWAITPVDTVVAALGKLAVSSPIT
jgi:hypothetical protein